MSWDVCVLKLGEYHSLDELPKGFEPEPLGASEEVRKQIETVYPSMQWAASGWGSYEGDGYSIECNIGKETNVATAVFHIRGEGDVLSRLVALCKNNHWQAYDISTGKTIDIEHPSDEGWKAFQKYRDSVL